MILGAIVPLVPSCRTEHTVSFWTLLKLKFLWSTRYLCGESFPMYQAALTLRLDTNCNSLASLNGSMTNFNIFLCEAKPILYYINLPYYQDENWKLFKTFPTWEKRKLKSSSLWPASDPKFLVGDTVMRHRASGNQPLPLVGQWNYQFRLWTKSTNCEFCGWQQYKYT